MSAKKSRKLRALTMTQKRLIVRPPASALLGGQRGRGGADAGRDSQEVHVVAPSRIGSGWGVMKMASRPTTIARTPSPSANAARMIARPRIWPAASGLRPIAARGHAGQDADADAGADDAEGGEAGAEVLHCVVSPLLSPAGRPGPVGPKGMVAGPVRRRPGDRRAAGRVRRGRLPRRARPPRGGGSPPPTRVNMRVRTLKISACTVVSSSSRPYIAIGMMPIVSAVMTPSATSPP